MSFDFDVIVIGSGFGGSVMSLRLTEKGQKVCLLERGVEYKMFDFPRRMQEVKDRLFWDPRDGKYGYMEIHDYPKSDVMTVTASGLGGGSLIYANVLLPMPEDFFAGWPGGINRSMLEPHYQTVIDMMEASPYPFHSNEYYNDTPKTKKYIEAFEKLKRPNNSIKDPEFEFPHLAVRFEGDFGGAQSKNKHGALQSSCNKCGECDLGCNIHAKNTLDLNYIFKAKGLGLEVRTEAEVVEIKPLEGEGYEVTYRNPRNHNDTTTIKAKKVVVSCGAVGSTALLLKQKKAGYLPNLNSHVGTRWSGNGDLLGFCLDAEDDIHPTKGPVITSAIKYRYEGYPDGFAHGMYLEDAGFPSVLGWYANAKRVNPSSITHAVKLVFQFVLDEVKRLFHFGRKKERNLGKEMADALDKTDFTRKMFVLLGMGRDRSDGTVTIENDQPVLNWNIDKSELHFDRVRSQMKELSHNMGGRFMDNPLTWLDKIVAVHPLGGCPMGDTADTGAVGVNGEVFGHPGLYVVDGSILPTSTGPNPSLTIAANAERIAAEM